jgi:hypothetical protein
MRSMLFAIITIPCDFNPPPLSLPLAARRYTERRCIGILGALPLFSQGSSTSHIVHTHSLSSPPFACCSMHIVDPRNSTASVLEMLPQSVRVTFKVGSSDLLAGGGRWVGWHDGPSAAPFCLARERVNGADPRLPGPLGTITQSSKGPSSLRKSTDQDHTLTRITG